MYRDGELGRNILVDMLPILIEGERVACETNYKSHWSGVNNVFGFIVDFWNYHPFDLPFKPVIYSSISVFVFKSQLSAVHGPRCC